MITKIDSIKDFGIFKNFNWNAVTGIEEFKEKNIIYGWNYSGKTTLSRIFSSLRDKIIHESYKDASFKLSCDGAFYENKDLSAFPYQVLVFNAEYAKENLRWEFDENINAIFFEVGENAKISAQIERLTKLINSINGTSTIKGKKEKLQAAINNYNEFENLFTLEAGRIKNDAFSSLIEFNKGHLKRIKDKIITNLDDYIIKSKVDLERVSKNVKIEEAKPKIDQIIFESIYEEIVEKSTEALATKPSKDNIITILDKNIEVYEWAKLGINLHEKGDSCSFCGNKISDSKYEELVKYFENESSRLKENINQILNLIDKEKSNLQNLNLPLSINDLNEGFQNQFSKKEIHTVQEIKKYETHLSKIVTLLNKKLSEKTYSVVGIKFALNGYLNLEKSIDSFNHLIKENNKFVDEFDKIVNEDTETYKNHLVALYLKQTKYLFKRKQYEESLEKIKKFDELISKHNIDINNLNDSKESDSAGSLQFNLFIQSFLSRNDIEIKLNETTKKFNLMRGTELAKNLSEGEKMAISFSHFFVNLKSIEEKGKLKDCIVYIDDPISSLDSNHIFQINSLLKEIFFEKIVDPLKPKNPYWNMKCKQLFISTHNFEFLDLLKQLPKKGGLGNKESRYFISRDVNESGIQNLPKVYSTFSSEYHFLFGEILEFVNNPNRSLSPKIYTIPNILRRFVEMYTLTKYPNMTEEVDGRAEVVFGKKESKRILKLLHYFSHFNSLDRIHSHSNFISDIEHACDDVISLIKIKDKLHYDALEASVTV